MEHSPGGVRCVRNSLVISDYAVHPPPHTPASLECGFWFSIGICAKLSCGSLISISDGDSTGKLLPVNVIFAIIASIETIACVGCKLC